MDTKTVKITKMSPLLIVADIDQSLEFYVKVLGFAIDFRYEDFYLGITLDGCSVHLKTSKFLVKESKDRTSGEDLEIVFSVHKIGDLYEEILKNSVEIVQPLRDMPYGKEFYVADPDGNVLAFIEEVKII